MSKSLSAVEAIEKRNEDRFRNRALAKDRPDRASECRSPSDVPCVAKGGHNFKFLPRDNYGCCDACGAEILT